MKLPRENPKAKYDIDVMPLTAYSNQKPRVFIQLTELGGKKQVAGVSLTEQETDDLIVMLTYYKNEQFPKAVADNG